MMITVIVHLIDFSRGSRSGDKLMRAAIPNGIVNPPYGIGECIHLETSEKLRSFLMRHHGGTRGLMLRFARGNDPFISPRPITVFYTHICDAV